MTPKAEKIKTIREEILDRKPKKYTKAVKIIFDGKQYNIRIPKEFAEIAHINTEKEVFEFTLEMPEDEGDLPFLYGDLIEKE